MHNPTLIGPGFHALLDTPTDLVHKFVHEMGAKDTLRAYKARHGLTWEALAKRLGISPDFARKLGCGDRAGISARRARRIERRSQGEIRAADLVA